MTKPSDRAIAQAFWETDSLDGDGSYRFEEKVIARAREIDAAAPDGAQPIALWCLHLQGPDEVIPAPTQAHAQKAADAINAYDDTGLVRAIAAPWPHSDQSHADDVGRFITEWMIPRGALAMEQASREFGTTPPQPQDTEDAARLDWLLGGIDRNVYRTIGGEWAAQDDVIGCWYGETPRAAIDAARAARGGGHA